jgi:pimeloyl-ACP methyl ester carboxylesterase
VETKPARPRLAAWWLAALAIALLATACSARDAPAGPGAPPPGTPTSTAAGTATPSAAARVSDPAFTALPGATASYGILGAAAYRIEVPDNWNGDLVLFAHGVQLGQTEASVEMPPGNLRATWIAGGYAWAASSYSATFYVPDIGAEDTLALLDHFEQEVGKPRRVYIAGESMGGHVAVLLLEQHAERFAGGLAVCGAVAGQDQLDYLVSWAMAAELVSGVEVPVGKGVVRATLALLTDMADALGRPGALTPAGEQFLSIMREFTGGPRPFFEEGFAAQFGFNFGLLLLDPDRQTAPVAAATNSDAVYQVEDGLGITAAEVNARIRRLPADPTARDPLREPGAVPTTGALAVPLLTLHTTGDMFVPISQQQIYRRRVEANGAGALLVQRAIREAGHCRFSAAELDRAWTDLVRWVEDGVRPAGDDLLGDLRDIGRQFTVPLRPGDPGTP